MSHISTKYSTKLLDPAVSGLNLAGSDQIGELLAI